MKSWLHAARLRTLPLASSSIILGSALALSQQAFSWPVLVLALVTALLLQILSNLANDYGDAVKGVDDDSRVGPQRAIQAGLLSPQQMLRAILVVALLSVVSGLSLLATSLGGHWQAWLGFIGLGGLAIVAAMAYTMGAKPYGYRGFGDISVFLFFGLLGVMGCYYLHTQSMSFTVCLVAAANGLLATAVLNINNLRDFKPDQQAGKLTLAVRLGEQLARYYHLALVFGALLLFAIYIVLQAPTSLAWLYLLPAMALIKVALTVFRHHQHQILDQQLQATAKLSFVLALVFSAGLQF
ncbi:1,4-dihydroxy-2-naphthoate polyprenyltransferase [Agarivorans sp. MS3-6]|uniref:1,4-dihydroxy-2-naphthoate polyprenyltransferase n=1 Tax=Agarivorans sp. TSD2052 TaxID=2937286 RepID=UPI002010A69A|nr:1,4-dihydroxy-2-naphthoate polyprenyltransferase [Agarivorans sp. TSD2052]UPW18394.1 1,4-dihydroxy-2-naphthoate polyprenyltransferase [Agarivorans sp. TSD2052]